MGTYLPCMPLTNWFQGPHSKLQTDQVFSAQIYNQFGKSVQAIKLTEKLVLYFTVWTEKTRVVRYFIYYINTNKIPSEFLGNNVISSHMNIAYYLHQWKDHCCYAFVTRCHIQKLNALVCATQNNISHTDHSNWYALQKKQCTALTRVA